MRGVVTRIFEYQLHVKDGDDLALALADINVAVYCLDARDLGRHVAILSLELQQVLLEPFLRPLAAVFIHPVPVVGVVENHCACEGRREQARKNGERRGAGS